MREAELLRGAELRLRRVEGALGREMAHWAVREADKGAEPEAQGLWA